MDGLHGNQTLQQGKGKNVQVLGWDPDAKEGFVYQQL